MPPKSRSSTSQSMKQNPVKFGGSTKSSLTTGFGSKKASSAPVGSGSGSGTGKKEQQQKQEEEEEDLSVLQVSRKLYKESKAIMGKPIHDEDWLPVHLVLRVFDTTEDYGPASNMTRLQRWERAKRLGLEPPEEIGTLLKTKPAMTRADLRDPVFVI